MEDLGHICLDCMDAQETNKDSLGNDSCSVCGGKRLVLRKYWRRLDPKLHSVLVAERLRKDSEEE